MQDGLTSSWSWRLLLFQASERRDKTPRIIPQASRRPRWTDMRRGKFGRGLGLHSTCNNAKEFREKGSLFSLDCDTMQPVSRGLAYSEPQLRLTQMDDRQLSSPKWNSGWEGLTMTDISGDRPSIVASASRFRLKSARSANSTMAGGRNSHSSFTEECRQETSVLAPEHISLE